MQGDTRNPAGASPDLSTMDPDQLLQRVSRCLIHNMSSPIAAIVGCAQLLDRALAQGGAADSDPCRAYAAMILSEAEKCARAMDRLALLARPPAAKQVPVDIHEVIRSALESFPLPPGTSLAIECGSWEPRVSADAELIALVLAELIRNAAEAMPEGGTITIGTENCDEEGKWVRVTVADEGPGIPPDVLPRAAAPFFSTRPRQNGIGLTICTQLIARHGGRFRLVSEPPNGTRATMDLPRV